MQKRYAVAEETEAEKYLNLQKQYVEEKSKLQYIQLFFIKKTIKTIQNKRGDIKLKIDEYLSNKKRAMVLLENKTTEFKSLSYALEILEKNILDLKNVIYSKKEEYAIIKESALHWQKKLDSACISLDNENKACDTNKRIIQEMKNELQQVDHMLTEMQEDSQKSIIELNDSQVKRYFNLKNEAEFQAKDFIGQINCLMYNQQVEQDKLDNVNRIKQEEEAKMIIKGELETRLKKLQNSSIGFKATVTEKVAKRKELSEAINEVKNKTLSLRDGIAKFSDALREAHVDKSFISQQMKKSETITIFKRMFSGVVQSLLLHIYV